MMKIFWLIMIFFLFVVIIRLYDVFGEGIDVVYDVDV